jgi:hypothetical protein
MPAAGDKSEKSTGSVAAGGLAPSEGVGEEPVFGPIRSLKSKTSGISGALATGAAADRRVVGVRFDTFGVAACAEGADAPAMSGKVSVGMIGLSEGAATRGGADGGGGAAARSIGGGDAKSAGGIVAGGIGGGANGRDAGRAALG